MHACMYTIKFFFEVLSGAQEALKDLGVWTQKNRHRKWELTFLWCMLSMLSVLTVADMHINCKIFCINLSYKGKYYQALQQNYWNLTIFLKGKKGSLHSGKSCEDKVVILLSCWLFLGDSLFIICIWKAFHFLLRNLGPNSLIHFTDLTLNAKILSSIA